MSDWTKIQIAEFMKEVEAGEVPSELVSRIVLERLPFTFDTKEQYFHWRHMLAEGLRVDPRDIVLVGSAATGRSLSARKRFSMFHKQSDIDIAVISATHFDRAWHWFRQANPALLGFDPEQPRLFKRHRRVERCCPAAARRERGRDTAVRTAPACSPLNRADALRFIPCIFREPRRRAASGGSMAAHKASQG